MTYVPTWAGFVYLAVVLAAEKLQESHGVVVADYNVRFAKAPRSAFDAHRPLRSDEDRHAILTWRVQRKVSQPLTLQHDNIIYLLPDTPDTRRLAMRYIDVWE
jgi:hypothetical protein